VTKVDLKKELKHLYNTSAKEVAVVDVPPMTFLMKKAWGPQHLTRVRSRVRRHRAVAVRCLLRAQIHD
jgi:hypothetical protein